MPTRKSVSSTEPAAPCWNTTNVRSSKNWFDTFIPEDIRSELRVVFEKLMAGEVKLTEYFDNMVLTRKGEIKITPGTIRC
jgi:hypothetical protein